MKKIFLIMFFFTTYIQASYMDTGYIEWQQPNEISFTARIWGDEFENWMETDNGYRICKAIDGYYYYAVLDENGEFIPSENKVGIDQPLAESYQLERSAERKVEIQTEIDEFNQQLQLQFEYYQNKMAGGDSTFNLAIVMVDFTPRERFKDSLIIKYKDGYLKAEFDSLIYSKNYWYDDDVNPPNIHPQGEQIFGSFLDYYRNQSLGKLDIIGSGPSGRSIVNPDSAGTGIPLWVQMDSSKLYYAITYDGRQGELLDTMYAVTERQLGIDLGVYDAVGFIYAGDMEGGGLRPNQKSYGKFCTSEGKDFNSNNFLHIGAPVHEFGHILGAADEYKGGVHPYYWDVMAKGCHNGPNSDGECPAPFSAPYRLYFDWIDPIDIITDTTDLHIAYNSSIPNFYKIGIPASTEYFVIERRQKDDFDLYTPIYENPAHPLGYGGILIWHAAPDLAISYDFVEIEFADNSNSVVNDRFPYPTNSIQDFNFESFPPSKKRNGQDSYVYINNIEWVSDHGEIDVVFNYNKINSNTIWDESFVLDKPVVIKNGAVLTINPGVNIEVSGTYNEQIIFYVEDGGTLLFSGTESQPVSVFSSNDFWGGIVVQGSGQVEMHYTSIENTVKALDVQETDATCIIANSNFKESDEECYFKGNLTIQESFFDDAFLGLGIVNQGSSIKNSIFYTAEMPSTKKGIYLENPSNSWLRIENCNIIGWQRGLQFGTEAIPEVWTRPEEIVVINNSFSACSSSINIYLASSEITMYYNNFFNNGQDLHTGANALFKDPKFVDKDNKDFHLRYESLLIDAGYPGSAFANEPEPNGGQINIGAYGNTTEATIITNRGGTISQNETWSEDTYISGDVTVAANTTLTVSPGVNVFFIPHYDVQQGGSNSNLSELIINGTIIANGTSQENIDFTPFSGQPAIMDWSGIKISGSNASASLNYCTIDYANSAITYDNNATGVISNSTINSNNYGIYISSSEPVINYCNINDNNYALRILNSYDPDWEVNHFSGNTMNDNGYAIYLLNSSPTFIDNLILENYRGALLWYSSNPIFINNDMSENDLEAISCYGGASPDMYYNEKYESGGYNHITSNGGCGVRIFSDSNPNLGNPDESDGGYNTIENNTSYEVYNLTENQVLACYNWWGDESGPDPEDIYGNVAWEPYLEEPPDQMRSGSSPPTFVYNSRLQLPSELQLAYHEQMTTKFQNAANLFKSYFTNFRANSFNSLAVLQYVKSLNYYLDPSTVANEIENTLSTRQDTIVKYELLSAQAASLVKAGHINDAIRKLDLALSFKVGLEKSNRLLFQKAFIYIYNLKNPAKGEVCLQQILINSRPGSEDYRLATEELNLLNTLNPTSHNLLADDDVDKLPQEYDLKGNFPNPFNPSTNIQFSIPKASLVKLEIFNVLGQRIKTLLNKQKEAAYYQIQWDGTNDFGISATTGIYFYRLTANALDGSKNFVKNKKMLLIR